MTPRRLAILREILSCPTAPFQEQAPTRHIRQWAQRLALAVQSDQWGNLLIHHKRGRLPGNHVPWVLTAHMDHPGFVSNRQRGRTVYATFFGSVAQEYFLGAKVAWQLPEDTAVGEVVKVHRSRRNPFIEAEVLLDQPSAVPSGTIGIWDLPACRIRGRTVVSRACDDLAGLAMAMCAMEEFAQSREAGELYLLATRAEEAGFVGALGAIRSGLAPKEAAILSIEASSVKGFPVRMGGGIIIRVGDRSSIFDSHATAILVELAMQLEEASRKRTRAGERFSCQRALMGGGTCEASAFNEYGYKSAALCLPLTNYHNQGPGQKIAAEHIHLDDFDSGVALLRALAGRSAEDNRSTLLGRLDKLWAERKRLL